MLLSLGETADFAERYYQIPKGTVETVSPSGGKEGRGQGGLDLQGIMPGAWNLSPVRGEGIPGRCSGAGTSRSRVRDSREMSWRGKSQEVDVVGEDPKRQQRRFGRHRILLWGTAESQPQGTFYFSSPRAILGKSERQIAKLCGTGLK